MSKNDINPLAPVTDLIFLKPGATRAELEAICAGARRAGIRAVCVAGSHVSLARHFLEDSEVKVIGTAGFPWGATDSDVKRYETEAAVDADAHEIEAVIHLGWLRDGDHAAIERELRDLIESADERPVRAVFEASLLTREQIAAVAQIAQNAGAHGIQTSTGLGDTGISLEDLRLIREKLGKNRSLKVAGGVRNFALAQTLVEAGATLLGTTSTAWLTPPPLEMTKVE